MSYQIIKDKFENIFKSETTFTGLNDIINEDVEKIIKTTADIIDNERTTGTSNRIIANIIFTKVPQYTKELQDNNNALKDSLNYIFSFVEVIDEYLPKLDTEISNITTLGKQKVSKETLDYWKELTKPKISSEQEKYVTRYVEVLMDAKNRALDIVLEVIREIATELNENRVTFPSDNLAAGKWLYKAAPKNALKSKKISGKRKRRKTARMAHNTQVDLR